MSLGVLILSAVIAVVGLYFTLRKNGKYKYPPSPPGYNFFKGGHAYLLPPNLDVETSRRVFTINP